MADSRICSVDGCGKIAEKRGWCNMHYSRWRKHGDVNALICKTRPREALAFIEFAKTYRGHDCLNWPYSQTSNGYSKIGGGEQGTRLPHRLVCEAAHGSSPSSELQVAHNCGNRLCVNPNHLRWATCCENHADKIGHGTSNRGARNGLAKLTAAEVSRIRELRGEFPQRKIAEMFGITQANVCAIQSGKSWGWL